MSQNDKDVETNLPATSETAPNDVARRDDAGWASPLIKVVGALSDEIVQPLLREAEADRRARTAHSREELEFADRQLARRHHVALVRTYIPGISFLVIIGTAAWLIVAGQFTYGLTLLGYIVIGTGGYGFGRFVQKQVDDETDDDDP